MYLSEVPDCSNSEIAQMLKFPDLIISSVTNPPCSQLLQHSRSHPRHWCQSTCVRCWPHGPATRQRDQLRSSTPRRESVVLALHGSIERDQHLLAIHQSGIFILNIYTQEALGVKQSARGCTSRLSLLWHMILGSSKESLIQEIQARALNTEAGKNTCYDCHYENLRKSSRSRQLPQTARSVQFLSKDNSAKLAV